MPPKPKKDAPSKKNEQKKKDKIVEDKTFGIKNKKGTKQQKFVAQVAKTVQYGHASARKMDLVNAEKDKAKLDKKAKADELNNLFRPVDQKVSKGVDPKSVLCAFFKQGQCGKGDRCKFSHDINVGRKAEKRSMYADKDEEEDKMDDWDDAKLEEVVNKKHGEKNSSLPKTSIICKFFLDAVENSKYGWFWECPNGGLNCHYIHALPPGFMLKRDKKKLEDAKEVISLEELIERERAALSSQNLTRVTLQTFVKWKERKKKEKAVKRQSASDKKKADFKAGKVHGISGREMFEFNPDLIEGDDEGADDFYAQYQREPEEGEEEDEERVVEIDLEELSRVAAEAGGPCTMRKEEPLQNGLSSQAQDESDKLDMAGALPSATEDDTEAAIAAAMSATVDGQELADAPIDDDLFDGEDIDLVDEELENLELDD